MECYNCPLFSSWNTENDRGEQCGLFGDSWDNPLQYENADGEVIGCYVDRHYIEKRDAEYCKYLEEMTQAYWEDEEEQP